jgi:HlyD family secretion protein
MMSSVKSILRFVIVIAIIAAAIAGGYVLLKPQPLLVETTEVTRGPITITVDEDGKTRIRERYIVSAPVAGQLSRIQLDAGDPVQARETEVASLLPTDPAMLDARSQAEATARLNAAKAAVKRAETQMQQAKTMFDLSDKKFSRLSKLREENAISQDEYEIQEADYLARKQDIVAAEFAMEIAQFEMQVANSALTHVSETGDGQQQLEPFVILSPIDGKVLRVFQESSTVVAAGDQLMEIGDPGNLEIIVDVLSTDAVRIRQGAAVSIHHWGEDQPLQGTVRLVEPAAFTKVSSLGVEEQRVNVLVDFTTPPDQRKTLGDNFRVETLITIEQHPDVLLVPANALFRNHSGWALFVVQDDRAILTKVEIGLRNADYAEILSGLAAAQRVINYPSDKIQDGALVKESPQP